MAGLLATGRPAGQPPFLFILRIIIAVLSLIVLALAAYSISIFSSFNSSLIDNIVGNYGTAGFLIFAAIWTWIIYGVAILLETRFPRYYFRIGAIIGFTLCIVFWLSAWAWAASVASSWLQKYCVGGFCYSLGTQAHREGSALAACAGIGALIWIFCIVDLVFFVRACMLDKDIPQTELGQVPAQSKVENTDFSPAAPAA